MGNKFNGAYERIDECRIRIPRSYKTGMLTDGIAYVDEKLLPSVLGDQALEQVANVACLPGIQGASMAMPDIHWGYGFPIGGVAATDPEKGGVISPGGVGYDINCGVRLIRTNLDKQGVQGQMQNLIGALFRDIPCGVGRGSDVQYNNQSMTNILERGSAWLVEQGKGVPADIEHTESNGHLKDANPGAVSNRARQRGLGQVGTLGAGNHFVEVQVIDEIYHPAAAEAYGLHQDQIVLMIHSGSRGLGHEVCSDSLRALQAIPQKYGIALPDRQLVCAPVNSDEGQKYLGAMRCAANYAWANRQAIMHQARQTFEHFFKMSADQLGMDLVYDVAHNIAKLEQHTISGEQRTLCVHRKGATRAFPPGHAEVPEAYRAVGQPVLIPGDMGRCSYLLAGQAGSMTQTFGSACHGAGRLMSRTKAVKLTAGRSIKNELRKQGIYALARGKHGLDEEQPDAYKDVSDVVEVVTKAGIAQKVCRMRPLGVIKG